MAVKTGPENDPNDDENNKRIPKQWNPIHDDDDLVPNRREGTHDKLGSGFYGGSGGGGGGGSRKSCMTVLAPSAFGVTCLMALLLRRKS